MPTEWLIVVFKESRGRDEGHGAYRAVGRCDGTCVLRTESPSYCMKDVEWDDDGQDHTEKERIRDCLIEPTVGQFLLPLKPMLKSR